MLGQKQAAATSATATATGARDRRARAGTRYDRDPRPRLGSKADVSVLRSVSRANAMPRPAKPARQILAGSRLWPTPSCATREPTLGAAGLPSGTSVAAASPPAARHPHCSSRLTLVLPPDPRRSL